MLTAIIVDMNQNDEEKNARVAFEVYDETKLVKHYMSIPIDSVQANQAPDKKQFILRSINDALRNLEAKLKANIDFDPSLSVQIGDSVTLSEAEPSATAFIDQQIIDSKPEKMKDAKAFLQHCDIDSFTNVSELKVVFKKLIEFLGIK